MRRLSVVLRSLALGSYGLITGRCARGRFGENLQARPGFGDQFRGKPGDANALDQSDGLHGCYDVSTRRSAARADCFDRLRGVVVAPTRSPRAVPE